MAAPILRVGTTTPMVGMVDTVFTSIPRAECPETLVFFAVMEGIEHKTVLFRPETTSAHMCHVPVTIQHLQGVLNLS